MFGDVVYNIRVITYYQLSCIKPCSAFSFLCYILWSYVQSRYWYVPSSFVLCSHGVPLYVYTGFCTKWHMYFPVGSGIFDPGHFAMGILLLSFSAPLLLWAFQKQMGFTFLFLNRIRNSSYNVLLQFSFLGSTYQFKCFTRKSMLLGFLTLHRSRYRWNFSFSFLKIT